MYEDGATQTRQRKLSNAASSLAAVLSNWETITCPILNVYAKEDHIIPPATSPALGGKVGSSDYSELGLPGGHVGVFVGGKAQALLGSGIADWLAKRD